MKRYIFLAVVLSALLLPGCISVDRYCGLSPEHRAAYRTLSGADMRVICPGDLVAE